MRRMEHTRNNSHQYQWTEEKGDWSVQMNDNQRMIGHQSEWIWVLDNSQFDKHHHFVHYPQYPHISWNMRNSSLQRQHSPIYSIHSTRISEPFQNNNHQSQWIGEKEDCSLQNGSLSRTWTFQWPMTSMTEISWMSILWLLTCQNAQSISLPHPMEWNLVLFDSSQHNSLNSVQYLQKRCTVPNQEHRMIMRWENEYLRIGGNRCRWSSHYHKGIGSHQMIIEGYLVQSTTKWLLSRITEPIYPKL